MKTISFFTCASLLILSLAFVSFKGATHESQLALKIDSLENLLKAQEMVSDGKCFKNKERWLKLQGPSKSFFSDVIGLATAEQHASNFRIASQISIPVAWEFELKHLAELLNGADGVRFYAAMNDTIYDPNYTLSLVAVRYKIDNYGFKNDITTSKIYNFSKICPTECDHAQSTLNVSGFLGRECN
ncbi:MAG: hypothetical protein H7296_01605 [Bacteroidia bacterium]|nr:hypothetical protein [Bacteroidia bacterium]